LDLALFEDLSSVDAAFFSLQKGAFAINQWRKVLENGWRGPKLLDYTDQLNSFADTAAFVEGLDLVLTVDTAMAHLAGALGKEVWILNRFNTDWRWALERDDSLWYPTAKIYRQDASRHWEPVVARLINDLKARYGSR
jgi:hypothetical protein